MASTNVNNSGSDKKKSFFNRYFKVRSSIYGQVIYAISILSFVLFLSFGVIFRSVNEDYLQSVIHQCGNRISFLVEGSLYQSMLNNDKAGLDDMLGVIKSMPGIDDIHIYDNNYDLAYTSRFVNPTPETVRNSGLDCKRCHTGEDILFSTNERTYKVVEVDSKCKDNATKMDQRYLFINSPVLNKPSCYTNDCHAHSKKEEVLGSMLIKIPLQGLDAALDKSLTDFFLMATILTVLLLVFLFFFTRKKIRNPLGKIINVSEAVARGDLSIRLEVRKNQLDDIKMLSQAFNNMLNKLNDVTKEQQSWSQQLEYKVQKKTEELKEAHHELIHVERMASLGKLSSSVAHEINNPLAGVLTYTKLVYRQLSKQDINITKKESLLKYLKVIETETKRCGEIVKGLLDFSRKDQQDFENKSLHKLLRETYDLMQHSMKMTDISFITDFSATSDTIKCGSNQIKQACVAILVNATEAISENGEIIIQTINPDKEHITIKFIDNGSGIEPEDIQHIFEPFFSNKQKASGIGLGLAIVHGIVQSHHGKVDVKSELGKGTTFFITLPVS